MIEAALASHVESIVIGGDSRMLESGTDRNRCKGQISASNHLTSDLRQKTAQLYCQLRQLYPALSLSCSAAKLIQPTSIAATDASYISNNNNNINVKCKLRNGPLLMLGN